jgi:hypothetical protein
MGHTLQYDGQSDLRAEQAIWLNLLLLLLQTEKCAQSVTASLWRGDKEQNINFCSYGLVHTHLGYFW